MADREKVIKGPECCILTSPSACRGCPYRGTPDDYPFCVHQRLQVDTLKLLEKESMTPFEVLERISSSYGGKQIFFQQKNGTIYDRYEAEYITLEEAVDRMAARLSSEAAETEIANRDRLAQATKQAEDWMSKAPYLCYDIAKELIAAAKEVTHDETDATR